MNGMHRLKWIVAFVMALGLNHSLCGGAEKEKQAKEESKSSKPSASAETQAAFLGVMVEELHPAIASHLGNVLSTQQGILVHSVSADSPAAKAGLKVHDILLTYDDQKLFSPEQLFKLVGGDKPGREVALGLVRHGKRETVKVQLGERAADVAAEQRAEKPTPQKTHRFTWPWASRKGRAGTLPPENGRPAWNSFDSMTLKKLDKDRFHASINHTDKEGKLQKHEFEGTRDEIHKKIEADADLTPDERTHLLRSLDLGGPSIPIWIFPDEDVPDF